MHVATYVCVHHLLLHSTSGAKAQNYSGSGPPVKMLGTVFLVPSCSPATVLF